MSIAPVSIGTISDVVPTGINVPPIDYTSRDYAALVNDLLTLIPSFLPEWTDRSPGDFGIVFIELFAYVGDILNFYSDRIANESYIATAQQRQSVLNIANMLDYTPHGNVAATVQVQFTISQPSVPVLIPGNSTQVATLGVNPVVFETAQDLWIFGDGVSNTATLVSNGTANQRVVLQAADPNSGMPTYIYNGAVNQTVTVTPAGGGTAVPWTLAPGNSLAGQAAAATMYTIVDGNTVQFGGGTAANPGAIPASGSTVTVTYQPAAPQTYTGLVPALNGVSTLGETIGISTGAPSQSYTLFNTPVVDGSVVVYVDEGQGPQPWTYFQRIVDALSSDIAFTLSTDANGVVTVTFGDGITGQIPTAGATITADYMVGGGSVGNVAANTLTQLQQGPLNVTTVTNPAAASGGADVETIDHIRIHAPLSITAINRAVTLDDYAALILNVPQIAKASAMSTAYNAVNLYIHPAGDFFGFGNNATTTVAALNAAVGALATQITNSNYTGYLDDKKMVTTSVVVIPPQYNNNGVMSTGYVPCNVSATVQVLPQYQAVSVQSAVTAAIDNLFLFAVVDFGYRVTLSSVYHAIMNVEGVDYVNVTALYRNEMAVGAADIVCANYEIPQAYQINVLTNGGLSFVGPS
jgi:Baseplate J-like protein